MSKSPFDIDEAKRRIEHLRKMPETPMRRRELAALERALEMAAEQKSFRRSTGSTRRATYVEKNVVEKEKKPLGPTRIVKRTQDGKKRVTIKKLAPKKPEIDNTAKFARERNEVLNEMKTLLGGQHRGMD